MRVVVVNEGPVYPLDCGRAIRIANLLIRLGRSHQITFVCRVEDEERARLQREFLGDFGIDAVTVCAPARRKDGIRFRLSVLCSLASSRPYSINSHNSRRLRALIRQIAAERAADLWQFEWLAYVDALPVPARTVLAV